MVANFYHYYQLTPPLQSETPNGKRCEKSSLSYIISNKSDLGGSKRESQNSALNSNAFLIIVSIGG